MSRALRLVRAGRTTVQDGGRVGHARSGVPRSGPMDAASHRLAALLAGARLEEVAGTAGLEVGPGGCVLAAVGGPVDVAVTGPGARCSTRYGQVTAPCVVRVEPGERVEVRPGPDAVWAVAVPAGGLAVPAVLGSRSQHPRSGLGPPPLVDGAELPVADRQAPRLGSWPAPPPATGPLPVLPGPHLDRFDPAVRGLLVGATFRTTSRFDRMAHLLDGPALAASGGHDVVSDGAVAGSLQVPGDGRVFVLTADHQTTGGYPRLAVLPRFALARFVQLPPGTPVRFAWSTVEDARAQLLAGLAAQDALVARRPTPHAAQLVTAELTGAAGEGSTVGPDGTEPEDQRG